MGLVSGILDNDLVIHLTTEDVEGGATGMSNHTTLYSLKREEYLVAKCNYSICVRLGKPWMSLHFLSALIFVFTFILFLIAPDDYLPVDELLTFSNSITTIEINVTLIDDDSLEENEIFRGRLSINTFATVAAVNPFLADVTILDDDSKIILLW